MINYYSLLPLISFMVIGFTWTMTFATHLNKPENKAFLYYFGFIGIWVGLDFVMWGLTTDAYIPFLYKLQSVFWNFMGFLFINFIYCLLNRPRDAWYYMILVMCFIGAYLTPATDLVMDGFTRTYWGVRIFNGPYFFPIVFFTAILPFAYAQILMVKKYFETTNSVLKKQLLLIFAGTFAPFIIGVSNDLIFETYLKRDTILMASGSASIQAILFFLAITRFRFLGIDLPEVVSEIFSNISDGVILISEDNKILNYNVAAAAMLNSDLDKKPLTELIENYDYNQDYKFYQTTIKRHDKIMNVLIAQAVINRIGGVGGKILVLTDISPLIKMGKELVEKNKELDAFVYRTSHDMKGPLSSIMGIINIARMEVTDTEALKYFDKIAKCITRLDHLMSDLLDIKRIKSQELVHERIYFKDMIREILKSLKYLYKDSKLDLSVNIDNNIDFNCDVKALNSILQNLIVNAINYRNEANAKCFININVQNKKEGIEITIADNGIGISDEHQAKVFEMFYRANTVTSGTGLGLYIVKSAVDKLGGKITLHSKEGIGTTFIVGLPLKAYSIKEKNENEAFPRSYESLINS